MKLWLLEAREDLPDENNPWEPWYDKCFGLVVRAPDEATAREIAAAWPGDEGAAAWRDPRLSECGELTAEGGVEIILKDYHSA